MSDKTFGRVVIAVCLVVLLLLALSSCATVQPEKKSAQCGDHYRGVLGPGIGPRAS